jgi:hypothetical protein
MFMCDFLSPLILPSETMRSSFAQSLPAIKYLYVAVLARQKSTGFKMRSHEFESCLSHALATLYLRLKHTS